MKHSHGGKSGHSAPKTTFQAPEWLLDDLQGGLKRDGTVIGHGHDNGHSNHAHGHFLNVHSVYEAAQAVGIDAQTFLRDYADDVNNFNDAHHISWRYPSAALAVLNDLTATVTMGGLKGNYETLELIQGAATTAALKGNGAQLRDILESAGGDASDLSNAQLVQVWATNSHFYNHSALKVHANDGSNNGFKLTHLRSLNDNAQDGTVPGTRGGYNDRGEYPERPPQAPKTQDDGFYDAARAFLREMDFVLPDNFEASAGLAARNGDKVATGGGSNPEPTPQPTPQPMPEPAPEPAPTPEPTPELPTPELPTPPSPIPTPQPAPKPVPITPPKPTPEPTPEPAPTPAPTQPEPPVADDDTLAFNFDIRNEWRSGVTVDVYVTNTGSQTVKGWQVAFDLDPGVRESWNGNLTDIGDDRYQASNVGWNATINAGETVKLFGFNTTEGDLTEAELNADANFLVL